VDVVFASPEWTLQQAAETMVRSGFRHLVVIDGGEVIGLLSMRDIVRVWADTTAPVAQAQAAAPA
jgi:CBS domain-containing protein